jgi:hypothetical protein
VVIFGAAREEHSLHSVNWHRNLKLTSFGTSIGDIVKTLKLIATDTKRTAELFRRQHSGLDDDNRYFRFDVDQGLKDIGLEDSKQMHVVVAATRRYVLSQATSKQLKMCARTLIGRECALTTF